MCGIAGEVVIGVADPSARMRIEGMVKAMAPRGPDDTGYRVGEGCALGMCRLAIIDIAGGAQPISTSDGRFHIVYNGECYATAALRRDLEQDGVVFRTATDTEVVVAAWARWGPASLSRLNGMFAFAIWDSTERELFLARDRLGIKPLFIWQDGERLVFASTLTAITTRSDFDGDVDPQAIELFLSLKFVTAPHTIMRDVRKLPAGHWARWRDGQLELREWWDVALEGAAPADPLEEVADLIGNAARIRLVSERPVGLCLSGGIDSGLLASALAGTDTAAFSLGFADPTYDESGLAAEVARMHKLEHHLLYGDVDVDRDFGLVTASSDEPLADSSQMALYALSRLIARHVTVVLSGSGGDELFGGYLRYLAGLLARATRYVPFLARLAPLLGGDDSKGGVRKKLRRFLEISGASPLDAYRSLLAPVAPAIAQEWRTVEFSRQLAGFSAASPFERFFERTRGASLLSRLMYTDLKTVLCDDYLVKEDRMTMAHSIEGRLPFLDYRLVELAFTLPDRDKIRGRTTKVMLRELAKARLPSRVARGAKRGFEVPLAGWFRGPLAVRLEQTLGRADARVNEYVRPATTLRLRREHASGIADHSRALYALLTLETWFENANRHRHP